MNCQNCGFKNKRGSKWCGKCGVSLESKNEKFNYIHIVFILYAVLLILDMVYVRGVCRWVPSETIFLIIQIVTVIAEIFAGISGLILPLKRKVPVFHQVATIVTIVGYGLCCLLIIWGVFKHSNYLGLYFTFRSNTAMWAGALSYYLLPFIITIFSLTNDKSK